MNISNKSKIRRAEMDSLVGVITEISKKHASPKGFADEANLESELHDYLWDYSFIKYDNPSKGFNIWRLTLPAYLIIAFLLMTIVAPIKWLLTGNYYFNGRGFLSEKMEAWLNKIERRIG